MRAAVSVAVSNPDKLFWPEEGFTKLDLVRYYDFIFPQLGNETANDPITSVALFKSKPVPDSGASWLLLGIAVGGLIILNRRLKAARHG